MGCHGASVDCRTGDESADAASNIVAFLTKNDSGWVVARVLASLDS